MRSMLARPSMLWEAVMMMRGRQDDSCGVHVMQADLHRGRQAI